MEKVKTSQPLVSIVMPTYNYARFITVAIESVLNQTYKNIELIIVDNYSSDNTEEIVRQFINNRVKYFKFSNNGIIANSRNFGIKNSRGEYIAFIDSDDIWFKNKIAAQIELFGKDPAVGLTFCPLRIDNLHDRLDRRIIGLYGKEVSGYLYENLILYNFIPSSSAMISSAVTKDVGFFNESAELYGLEDFELWLRIARKYKIAAVPEVMGIYRIHESNQGMHKNRLEHVFILIGKHYENGWISRNLFKKARAQLYFREGWSFLGKKSRLAKAFFYKTLHEDSRSFKVIFIGLAGIILSFFPPICRFIKNRSIDKKIGMILLY